MGDIGRMGWMESIDIAILRVFCFSGLYTSLHSSRFYVAPCLTSNFGCLRYIPGGFMFGILHDAS
ncbi:MAG: hypothetical protein OQK98_14295 [Gammaproteobacteria bacterium]|nr:hypothetical protein [Gammaproteobacteria bacterium]